MRATTLALHSTVGGRRVLGTADIGIDGAIRQVPDAGLVDVFGLPHDEDTVWDWLGADDHEFGAWLALAFTSRFEEGFDVGLPAAVAHRGRTFCVEWCPVAKDGLETHILCTLVETGGPLGDQRR